MLKYLTKLDECYLFSSGGLGDIVLDYLTKWLKVIDAHKKYELKINVVLKTTNKFSAEFFEYNPYFNKIYFEDFAKNDQVQLGMPTFQEVIKNIDLHEDRMPIFLNNKEKAELAEISSPYIVLHPFAGEDFRSWHNKVDLKSLVNDLIDRGYSVVMIGGSHFREANIEDQRNYRAESFDYTCSNFFNKVGKAGPRLCTALVEKSDYFIGASSCYLTASWCFEGKSLAIVPSHDFLAPGNWWGDVIHEKSLVVSFSELPKLDDILSGFLSD